MSNTVPEHLFEVDPGWVDYNDHMNMGFYVVAFDLMATDPFYEDLGIGEAYLQKTAMTMFTLASSTDYLGELFAGDKGRITTQLLDWDHKRLHYIHQMFDADAQLVATNELLGMNVDMRTRKSAAFPDDVQQRLADLMDAHATLPRPPQVGRVMGIRRPT